MFCFGTTTPHYRIHAYSCPLQDFNKFRKLGFSSVLIMRLYCQSTKDVSRLAQQIQEAIGVLDNSVAQFQISPEKSRYIVITNKEAVEGLRRML